MNPESRVTPQGEHQHGHQHGHNHQHEHKDRKLTSTDYLVALVGILFWAALAYGIYWWFAGR